MNHWKKTVSILLSLSLLIAVLVVNASALPNEENELEIIMLDDYTLQIIGLSDDLVNPVADICYEERVDV